MPIVENKARTLMVVPTLGQRIDLLQQTFNSIKEQGPDVLDVIVVYPLKNKKVKKLVEEYGYSSADDPGTLSGAINIGIDYAKSLKYEYFTWFGDDDLLRPDSIKTSTQALDNHKYASLAYGYCDYIDEEGRILFTNRAGRLATWLMSWGPNLVPLPGMVYRTSSLLKAGKFDETLKYAMDLDMLLRMRKVGSFINTKKVLAAFRWHATSTTVSSRTASLKEAELIKRKHLHKTLRPIALIWEAPVRHATYFAAKRVNKLKPKKYT